MTSPTSASTVTTRETLRECAFAITTFRHHHPSTPIYVACPPEIAAEVTAIAPGVTAVIRELTTPGSVKRHNGFHRPDAILLKMDAMDAALIDHPDTLFFDADLVFLRPVTLPAGDHTLVLSLNLSESADMGVTAHRFGMFNAGFLWTSSREFPSWWRKIYENPLQEHVFYEQTALSRAGGVFRCGYFGPEHNYGFWRGSVGMRPTASIHCHVTDCLPLTPWMRDKTLHLRRSVVSRLPEPLLPAYRDACGHPSKIFFIHYGKAGGVYANIALKALLRGYEHLDSWVLRPGGEERDWTRGELDDILTDVSTHRRYLHQHHVNLHVDQVELALKHGWRTVMFYRDPRDLICSLYHWGAKVAAATGRCPVFEEPAPFPMPFDAFFERIILPRWQDKWCLPWWAPMVEFCRPFSPAAVDEVTDGLLGVYHQPHDCRNASPNPGWRATLRDDHLRRLEELVRYRHSLRWIESHADAGDGVLPLEGLLSSGC